MLYMRHSKREGKTMLIFEDVKNTVHIVNEKEISNVLIHEAENQLRVTIHFLHSHVLTTQVTGDACERIKRLLSNNT